MPTRPAESVLLQLTVWVPSLPLGPVTVGRTVPEPSWSSVQEQVAAGTLPYSYDAPLVTPPMVRTGAVFVVQLQLTA